MSNEQENPNAPQENPTETEVGGRTLYPNTTVPQDQPESTTVPQDDA